MSKKNLARGTKYKIWKIKTKIIIIYGNSSKNAESRLLR